MWRLVRAWATVHALRPASAIVAVTAVASLVFARSQVQNFGVLRLLLPTSVLLLLPALAGVGAAVACANEARLPLPDPPRAILARGVWVVTWTVAATLAANAATLSYPDAEWKSITRNTLLYTAIGLLMVRAGYPLLVWLPVLGYTIACMMFGYPATGPGYYWWAVVMKAGVTTRQALVVGAVFLACALGYVLPSATRRSGRGM